MTKTLKPKVVRALLPLFDPLTDGQMAGYCGATETTRILTVGSTDYLEDQGRVEAYAHSGGSSHFISNVHGEAPQWEAY